MYAQISTLSALLSTIALLSTSTQAAESKVKLCDKGVNGAIVITDNAASPPNRNDVTQRTAQILYQLPATPLANTPTGEQLCGFQSWNVYPPNVKPRLIITGGHQTLPDYLKDPNGPGGYLQSNHNSPDPVYIRWAGRVNDKINWVVYAYSDVVGNVLACGLSYESDDQAAFDAANIQLEC